MPNFNLAWDDKISRASTVRMYFSNKIAMQVHYIMQCVVAFYLRTSKLSSPTFISYSFRLFILYYLNVSFSWLARGHFPSLLISLQIYVTRTGEWDGRCRYVCLICQALTCSEWKTGATNYSAIFNTVVGCAQRSRKLFYK